MDAQRQAEASGREGEAAIQERRQKVRWLVRLACGILLVAAILWRAQGTTFWSLARVFRQVPWPVVPLAVLFYWAGQVMSAWKWQILLRARGVAISLRQCCRWYAVGMFWNLWMPTNIGGDAIRVYMAAPRCGGRALAASSILVERLTGFLALLVIGAIALVIDAPHNGKSNSGLATRAAANGVAANGAAANGASSHGVSFGSGAFANGVFQSRQASILLAALGVLFGLWLGWLLARWLLRRLETRAPQNVLVRRLAPVRAALEAYGKRAMRRTLVMSMLLSLGFQASQIVLNIGLARAVGLDVPAGVFWWLVPLLALASLLPIGIGGLGVREAAATVLLAGSGANAQMVVLWSLMWQATVWLASFPGILWRDAEKHDGLKRNGLKRDDCDRAPLT